MLYDERKKHGNSNRLSISSAIMRPQVVYFSNKNEDKRSDSTIRIKLNNSLKISNGCCSLIDVIILVGDLV